MILGALDDAGGQQYLVEQAHKNPTAFLTLLGKILHFRLDDRNEALFLAHALVSLEAIPKPVQPLGEWFRRESRRVVLRRCRP